MIGFHEDAMSEYRRDFRGFLDARRDREASFSVAIANVFSANALQWANEEPARSDSDLRAAFSLSARRSFESRVLGFLPMPAKRVISAVIEAVGSIPDRDVASSREFLVASLQATSAKCGSAARAVVFADRVSGDPSVLSSAGLSDSERQLIKDFAPDRDSPQVLDEVKRVNVRSFGVMSEYVTNRTSEEKAVADGTISRDISRGHDFVRFQETVDSEADRMHAAHSVIFPASLESFVGKIGRRATLRGDVPDVFTHRELRGEKYVVVRPLGSVALVGVPLEGIECLEDMDVLDLDLRFTPVGTSYYVSSPEERLASDDELEPGVSRELLNRLETRSPGIGVQRAERDLAR